jgi:hypothetical protein
MKMTTNDNDGSTDIAIPCRFDKEITQKSVKYVILNDVS